MLLEDAPFLILQRRCVCSRTVHEAAKREVLPEFLHERTVGEKLSG
jgi:hypothetical protein